MKTLKITLLCCLISGFTFTQTVHTVDNRSQSGAMFTALQTAINAATAGDIIQIHPSATSYGSVSIGKTLTLVGLGHDPITNNQGLTATLGNISFFGTAANSEIKGLTINVIILGGGTANNLDGIHIIHNKISVIQAGSTNGLTDSWVVEGNYITSTTTGVSTQATGWLIKNNFMLGGIANLNVTNLVTNNIFFSTSNSATDVFFSNCTSTIISNNIFVTNGNMTEFGISNSTNLDFRNNLTYSFVGNTIVALPGTNLDNTNPMFVTAPTGTENNFYANDYQLAGGSPGINYGTDGTNIGVFGNNFLFDIQGRPDLMPFPTSITINNNVVAPNQDLDVNFTAEQKQ